jgi:hypothetical protein
MDQNTFLVQPDVRDFIAWLQITLPQLNVHLRFASSKFVKGGMNLQVIGIEQVHAQYRWGSGWRDYQDGQWVASSDWCSTNVSLQLLRSRLTSALAAGCQTSTYNACRAVLQWGGVRGAVPFLGWLRDQGKLVSYLEGCRPLFDLNGQQTLSQLDEHSILRFDAGLTKIHALIDTSGSPIYDSRVGAAIAMLYALYRQGAQSAAVLSFPTGPARGVQLRDPGALGYQKAPQFFSKPVPGYIWARSQLELGWIIQATLERTPGLFSGSLPQRCHQFEAALFMIGYDLRCLVPSALPATVSAKPSGKRVRTTWVPSGVTFPKVLQDYLARSQSVGHAVALSDFKQWQIQVNGRKANTASSYCAPFRPREFDLVSFSLEALKQIAKGGEKGLQVLSGGATTFVAGDEYEQVYLTNVYLYGRATKLADKYAVSPVELLLRAGFAGTASTAKLILRIGKALGEHFDLIHDGQPNALFAVFFAQALTDLDDQLMEALQAIKGGTVALVDEEEGTDCSPEFAEMILQAAEGEFTEIDVDELFAMIDERVESKDAKTAD